MAASIDRSAKLNSTAYRVSAEKPGRKAEYVDPDIGVGNDIVVNEHSLTQDLYAAPAVEIDKVAFDEGVARKINVYTISNGASYVLLRMFAEPPLLTSIT